MRSVIFAALTCLLIAAGCSSKQNIKPPHELVEFSPTINVEKVWSSRVGKGAEDTNIRLRPSYADGVLYVVNPTGMLAALDAETGKTLWQTKRQRKGDMRNFAGGPSIGAGQVFAGTLDGHLYAFDQDDGEENWKVPTSAGVLAKPVVENHQVIVRTNDGRISSYAVNDGQELWVYDQTTVPLLSLRGNGSLLVTNGVVFFGSDDGKLIALRSDTGEKLWEQPLARMQGHTDIDRLGDADGAVLLANDVIYAGSYQGRIVAVDGPSARVMWSQPFSSYDSMTVDPNNLYAANDASEVWAFDLHSGSNVWRQAQLAWRWVTGPAMHGGYILVGDLEGYLHWLSPDDGRFVARERMARSAIRSQPLVVGDMAYVEDVDGRIAAYKIH